MPPLVGEELTKLLQRFWFCDWDEVGDCCVLSRFSAIIRVFALGLLGLVLVNEMLDERDLYFESTKFIT